MFSHDIQTTWADRRSERDAEYRANLSSAPLGFQQIEGCRECNGALARAMVQHCDHYATAHAYVHMTAQRDELLAALRDTLADLTRARDPGNPPTAREYAAIKSLRAALAKADGAIERDPADAPDRGLDGTDFDPASAEGGVR